MAYDFELDPRLDNDSLFLTDWPLCRVLRMNDRAYPWLILVPRRTGKREIIDLSTADQGLLLEEIGRASRAIKTALKPEKLNVAALGNVVAQLHVHVVGRFADDPAWPRPIWGVQAPQPFDSDEAEVEVIQWRERLA
ncbi:HIT domain-containing protein [Dongia sedimenti]|uniref:HIT family protein n=1 Tax=Dongia sedimenti TaxID=3064282 RepID=A0ABU0YKW1_9PROT|nr:HIT family protein [Rhodospirillaceae bacterium R-7]